MANKNPGGRRAGAHKDGNLLRSAVFASAFLLFLLSPALWSPKALFASDISFSGGFTKVSLQEGAHTVTLSGSASVKYNDVSLDADTIELYGDDYNFVRCTGNVKIVEQERNISLSCPSLVYNRGKEQLLSDGWIEIDDKEHEVKLSGAYLDYDKNASRMLLQIRAKIEKDTDDGLMTCTADSIEYNSDNQTVVLKGSATVVWGDDTYRASLITVNLDTEDVVLHGSIEGTING